MFLKEPYNEYDLKLGLHIYLQCKSICRLLGILTAVTMAVGVLPQPKALVLHDLEKAICLWQHHLVLGSAEYRNKWKEKKTLWERQRNTLWATNTVWPSRKPVALFSNPESADIWTFLIHENPKCFLMQKTVKFVKRVETE